MTAKNNRVPVTVAAKVLGWTVQRARRYLRKNNCLVKIGGRWFLDKEKMLANFPNLRNGDDDGIDYTTTSHVSKDMD